MHRLVGWAVSALLVVALVGRVDVSDVARALGAASLGGLVVAIGLVAVEVALRAWRWRILLQGAGRPAGQVDVSVAYPRAVAYLCVGYFANTLLPARLGDLGRAHLTGRDLGISRSTTLGTIVVERIADAGLILLTVLVLALLTPAARIYAGPAVVIGAIGIGGGALGLLILRVVRRRDPARPGIIGRIATFLTKIAAGADAVRSRRGSAAIAGLTAVAFGFAVVQFWVVAGAVGLALTPMEAGIVMGTLALSTAIPAAPGSLGTYELAGVTVLVALGAAPVPALAAVVLIHVIATVPPALAGIVAFGRLQLKLGDLRGPASGESVAAAS